MVTNFARRLIGDTPDRKSQRLMKRLVPEVGALEAEVSALDDAGLRARTDRFRTRLAQGDEPDDLMAEAFAVVREAARRTLGQRHYDVQLAGGAVLHDGCIAEMKTGEGKTLVATLPAYLNALSGKGVHVVTVNDYLAARDAVWMGPIYHLLGLTVGCLQHENSLRYDPDAENFLSVIPRREAYGCDVTYGTNNEFGFDYLRDNMAVDAAGQVQCGRRHYAIIDEVDNILIDEARTPLIISGPSPQQEVDYRRYCAMAAQMVPQDDFTIEERSLAVILSESGIEKAERALGVDNLYDPGQYHLVQYVENAMTAQFVKLRDQDYVVQNGEVVIVDEFTGRLQPGRRWSDGLHQAVEAKERVRVQRTSATYATVTLQNYFRLYDKLAGMTGTAVTDREEFYSIYGLDVAAVPTNLPMVRRDLPDRVYATEDGKWNAVVEEIRERSGAGQPVLVGTTSVEASEELSNILRRTGVRHEVLNARNHHREADIVAQAGRPGAVTVSTNMAGRGTDIVLGGPAGDDGWQRNHDRVVALGGLHVIGTEHHEARRVDDQLRGRAGRQGDPGSTQFYVSLEDELMQRFGGDRMKKIMMVGTGDESTPIESRQLGKVIGAVQNKVEGIHYDSRKHLLNYDDVLNRQRQSIYTERERVLSADRLGERAVEMMQAAYEDAVNVHLADLEPEDWERVDRFQRTLAVIDELPDELTDPGDVMVMDRERVRSILSEHASRRYRARQEDLGEGNMDRVAQLVMLRAIDLHWVLHLTEMENLRTGVGLQAYGQRDPLLVYRSEASRAFDQLWTSIRQDTVGTVLHVGLAEDSERTRTPMARSAGRRVVSHQGPVRPKLGRNAPCHCGSGRKYKRCCWSSDVAG